MKKIIIILVMLLLVFSLFGESLNDYSIWTKENFPYIYTSIKAYSIYNWGDNPELVSVEINKQCGYLYKSLAILNEDPDPEIKEAISVAVNIVMNMGLPLDWKLVYDNVLYIKNN